MSRLTLVIRHVTLSLALGGGFLPGIVQAQATLTWDQDGPSNDWNTTTANWVGGLTFGAGDFAIFDSTGETVSVAAGGVVPGSTTISSGSWRFEGGGIGGGSFVHSSAGTTVLTEASAFSSTVISGGTVRIQNADALGAGPVTLSNLNSGRLWFSFGDGSTTTVANDMVLPSTGYSNFTVRGTDGAAPTTETTVRLTGAADNIVIPGSREIVIADSDVIDTGAFTATIANLTQSGNRTFRKTGSGTLVINGTSSVLNTQIQAGTLQVGDGGTTGALGSGTITNEATLTFNRSDNFSFNNRVDGATGGMVKLGAGTMTIGTNTDNKNSSFAIDAGRVVSQKGGRFFMVGHLVGSGGLPNGATITIASGATLDLDGNQNLDGDVGYDLNDRGRFFLEQRPELDDHRRRPLCQLGRRGVQQSRGRSRRLRPTVYER